MFNRLWNSFWGLTDVSHCCLVKSLEMSRKSAGEVCKIWMDFIVMALEFVSWFTYSLPVLHDIMLCDII